MTAPTELSLTGRTAMVTGGGSGLGHQFSEALAHQGASLLLVGRTEQTLAGTCEELPGKHDYVVGDLCEEEVYATLADRADNVDILVNNAGGDIRKGGWLDQTPDDWHTTYALNVVAAVRLSQLYAPGMVTREWGRIINVASVYGFLGQDTRNTQPGMDAAAYIAAKHATIGLTRFLAGRLSRDGVTANAISPGMFPLSPDDPALEHKPWKKPDPGRRARLDDLTPVGRSGGPRDLGAAVVFLASPAAAFVTGQNVAVDGGWSVW